jgi:hypothetical protein
VSDGIRAAFEKELKFAATSPVRCFLRNLAIALAIFGGIIIVGLMFAV